MANNAVQARYNSSYTIQYPDFPSFDITPQNIKVYQEIGKQDVVELTYPRFSSFYIRALKTGVPIKIRWNNDTVNYQWYGYVYDVKKNTNPSLGQPVVVRCIASSLALKEGGTKIWKNKTAPDIVKEIAKKFKLKPIVTPHKTIFTQQSLSGLTYWEKIQQLANDIGYAAHVIGTELHFHPIDIMIDKFMTTIPNMSIIDISNPPNSSVLDQTLDSFRATCGDFSDANDHKKKTKKVYGVDPLSAKFYGTTASSDKVGKNVRKDVRQPIFTQLVSTAVSGSKEMAQVLANAHAQLSRFVHHATGTGQGHPNVAPWRTIEISGTGEDTDAFWVVKKATHFLTHDGRYNVEFACMADGRGQNKPSATRPATGGSVPTRNVAQELVTGAPKTPTSSKLSATTNLINQTQSGFKVTPRRWVGR